MTRISSLSKKQEASLSSPDCLFWAFFVKPRALGKGRGFYQFLFFVDQLSKQTSNPKQIKPNKREHFASNVPLIIVWIANTGVFLSAYIV